MSTDPQQTKRLLKLQSERDRLAELFQNKSRHADVLENQLRRLTSRLGLASATVDIVDPIDPVDGGINLRSRPGGAMPFRCPAEPRLPSAARPQGSWPRRQKEPIGLVPNAGTMNYTLHGRVRTVLGFSVLGLGRERLKDALDQVARQQSETRKFVPVFLYDGTDFDLFRQHGFVFEWLPPAQDRALWIGCGDWNDYVAERIALLRQKWSMADLVDLADGEALGDQPQAQILQERLNLFFWPDYTESNPYQNLLYAAVADRVYAMPGDIGRALRAQQVARQAARCPVLFHLHWEDMVYKTETSLGAATQAVASFLEHLEAFVAAGGMLLWTVHNEASHENAYEQLDHRLRCAIARLAHRVHVHAASHVDALCDRHDIERGRIVVVPHGSYCGLVHEIASSPRDENVRFIHFGKLRPYKGTTDLVEAFARMIAPHATLTVTGQSFLPEPLTVPEHIATRIMFDARKLSEQELAQTVADADFAVLPYRRILSSGSLLFAFTLGVPAIVPDLPAMRELVADGENGFLYAANEVDALAAALARAAATSIEEREAMRIAARASAERLAWSNLADRLRTLFDNAPLEDLAA